MAHDHVYGFCGHKCKVEVAPKPVVVEETLYADEWEDPDDEATNEYRKMYTYRLVNPLVKADDTKQIIGWSVKNTTATLFDDEIEWFNCGVCAYGQFLSALIFKAEKRPENDISILLSIQEVPQDVT